MNYENFGEGKKFDWERLDELVKASSSTELRKIASFWNFFKEDFLVGLVCDDERFHEYKGIESSLTKGQINRGDIIAPAGQTLIKHQSSGLYLIEGVITEYRLLKSEKDNQTEVYAARDEKVPVSQLVLPTDKFIPLYTNMYKEMGLLPPPTEFGYIA